MLLACSVTPFMLPLVCVPRVPPAPCVVEWIVRDAMRGRHNIDETECASKLKVMFCCPCAMMQAFRELESIGVWPGTTCFTPTAVVKSDWPVLPTTVDGLPLPVQRLMRGMF